MGATFKVFGPVSVLIGANKTVPGPFSFSPPTTLKAGLLGITERSPIVEFLPEYVPIFADATMRRIPFDHAAAGTHALIRVDNLNYFDFGVYESLITQVVGLTEGTLIQLEGQGIIVTLDFAYGDSYTFPSCTLVAPQTLSELCTTAGKIGLVFHAIEDENGILYE